MAQRTVKPERVTTLKEWVARWPKATNLGFDEETREPVVFSSDDARSRVGSFPWRREGDTITLLTQPTHFSQQAVTAARKRFGRIVKEKDAQMRAAGEEALRGATAQLLETRRAYDAAPPTVRPGMRRDVLTAERANLCVPSKRFITKTIFLKSGVTTTARTLSFSVKSDRPVGPRRSAQSLAITR